MHDIELRVARLEGQMDIVTKCLGGSPCRCGGRVVFALGLATDAPAMARTSQSRRHFSGVIDMATDIKTEQTVTIKVAFLNDKGKPAKVDGTPTWATDNSDIVTLKPAADGMSCEVVTGIMAGAAKVMVDADADLGAGKVDITGTAEFNVLERPATNVVLTVGTPTDV